MSGTAGTGGGGPTCAEPAAPLAATLLPELVGHGRETTGGRSGCVVRVTSLEDDGPGSLREALAQEGPAWIVFDESLDGGRIELESDIDVTSDKAIDGRGIDITVATFGLAIASANVIVESVTFDGDASTDDTDAGGIWISENAADVWVSHVAISGYREEYIEVSKGATKVTISWSYFAPGANENSHPLLFGDDAGFDSRGMFVTMHHNWFDRTASYAPRLRMGVVHSFNNWFYQWEDYASGSSVEGHLYSERNVYTPGTREEAAIVEVVPEETPGFLRSFEDIPERGGLAAGLTAQIFTAEPPLPLLFLMPDYPWTADPAGSVKTLVQAGAGPR
jgi:pectate lyase